MTRGSSLLKRYGVWLVLIVVSLSFFMTCSDTSQMPNTPVTKLDGTTFSMANPKVRAIADIQDKYTPKLLEAEDLVGTATGLDERGNLVIRIYAAEPGIANVPKTLDGVPVEVVVTGRFKIYSDPTARFARPVPIGVSTGHPNITAGTIGCRVKDANGNVYALSNNHVYADVNSASIGDNVLQPGPTDGGTDPADAIGTLYDYQEILLDGPNNYIDAAIAITDVNAVGYATPSDAYGAPSSSIVDAYVGQKVQKYGRTTVWTHGEVSELNVTVDVCYIPQGPVRCKSYARFIDQIAITPGTFSDGGDSGSLIVTDDSNKNPVGLLFAGSSERTLANPIHYVLDRFNVTIDDGSGGTGNVPPTADFTYTTTELTADFTDQSTDSDGSVVSWAWDFGDGGTSTAQNPSHTYGAAGTYTVTLTVTDDAGATDTASQDVTVSSGSNAPPTADFTYTTTDLAVDFTDQSTDSDGSIVSWAWDFGDGGTSTAQNPSHTYGADGTYTVSLTVTDDAGATDSASQDVTVSSSSGGGITLSTNGYKVRGRQTVDLTWSGAVGTQVNVFRDGVLITTTNNDGAYTDNIGAVGGGSYVYQVCETDGSACSNESTVTF